MYGSTSKEKNIPNGMYLPPLSKETTLAEKNWLPLVYESLIKGTVLKVTNYSQKGMDSFF